MKWIKLFIIPVLCCTLLFAGCSASGQTPSESTQDQVTYDEVDANADWDADSAQSIVLDGDTITFTGSGATVSGSDITITKAGTYVISGSLDDGLIIVDADKEDVVQLVLNGAEISCSYSAAIYVKNAEKTVLTLADGTENTVTDGDSYVYDDEKEEEPNAAIFSKDDLTINGDGTLRVYGNFNNGITSKDDLKIMSGTLYVYAADDGLMGRDMVGVLDGTITVESDGDGVKSTNNDGENGYVAIQGGTFNITAGTDGIQAKSAVLIEAGDFTISTGGGSANSSTKQGDQMGGPGGQAWGEWGNGEDETAEEDETSSAKGIKAIANITITGGTFTMDTSDDAIHSNGNITIDGGVFNIASGDDGIHADASLTITGGDLTITQSYEGLESAVITIEAGDMWITASDDGINVAGGNDGSSINGRPGQNEFAANDDLYLQINGGYIVIDAGGDGLDSNGNMYMTGGTVIVNGPTNNGNGSLDYNGTFESSGGVLVAVGSSGMAQAPSTNSTQYSVLMTYDTVQTAGTLIHLEDSNGNDILTFASAKEYQSLLFSSPDLSQGETYTLYTGGTSTGSATDGLYAGGTYTGGTEITDFTITDMVTYLNSSGVTTGGGFGQGPGDQGQMPEGTDGQAPADMDGKMQDGQMPGGGPGGQGGPMVAAQAVDNNKRESSRCKGPACMRALRLSIKPTIAKYSYIVYEDFAYFVGITTRRSKLCLFCKMRSRMAPIRSLFCKCITSSCRLSHHPDSAFPSQSVKKHI